MPEQSQTPSLTVEVTDLNNLGYGVGHLPDGKAIFLHGAVAGDCVRAVVIKQTKTYAVGRVEEILKPSADRIENDPCTAAASCGGCVYRNITYEFERESKRAYVAHAFRKVGLPDVRVLPVLGTSDVYGYRNKAQYPVKNTKNGIRAGFYSAGTHNVIPAEECPLQPPVFGQILHSVCAFCDENGIRAYDEVTGKGLLRHIYLRHAKGTGQVALCLVLNGKTFPYAERFVSRLTEQFPCIASVMLNENTRNTNVVLGDTFRTLWGEPYLEDVLCGKTFRIAPESFYQVNHDAAELLYGLAADLVTKDADHPMTVMDLYCGAGTIGLSMADRASVARLIGVEIVPGAVECAKQNAARNGIANASFYCGDASSTEKLLASAEAKEGTLHPDAVVIDPPRKGTTQELISFLAARGVPKIVYVSCDPDTLARDCAWFREAGYSVGTAQPVDLFPRTGHVETVVLLTREKT